MGHAALACPLVLSQTAPLFAWQFGWLSCHSFSSLPPSPTPVRSLLERLGDELSLLPPQQLLIPPAMQRPSPYDETKCTSFKLITFLIL